MKIIYLICSLVFSILSFNSFATTYTFTGNGSYTTAANWQGNIPAPYGYNSDTIIITGTCTLTINFSILKYTNSGFIWVKPSGVFNTEGGFGYYFYNGGAGSLRMDGIFNNNSGFSQEGVLDVYGTLKNYQLFNIVNSLTLHSGAIFENNSQLSFVSGQVISEPGSNFINKGSLVGNIAFAGSSAVSNTATLAPGNSPGTATINGDYTASSSAVHNFEIAGAGSSDYDKLVATGIVVLNGTLNVSLLNGYTPQLTDYIPIFTGSAISGSFATVNKPAQYQLIYGATSVVLRNISVLPVSFSNVTVQKEGSGVRIIWELQNELNVSHYEIEKSDDGKNFRKIGETIAAYLSQYRFYDPSSENKAFYRIKNVDKDGKYNYSIVVMYNQGKGIINLMAFPSPAKSDINIQHAAATESTRIVISSIDGRTIQTIFPVNGTQTTTVNLSNVKPGAYFVRYFNWNEQIESVKFIKE